MEMRILGSLLLDCAEMVRVPAGSALAVDRVKFSRLVTERIRQHPLISVRREEARLHTGASLYHATGPLNLRAMALALREISGEENLLFYDAVAPTVTRASLDEQGSSKPHATARGVRIITTAR